MNPRQMNQMMRKLGMSQVEIDAYQVIIKCQDKEIIINNPSVSKVNMMGQDTFQITGKEEIRVHQVEISEDDIKTVAQQAGVSIDKAKEALLESKGDIATAILNLQSN